MIRLLDGPATAARIADATEVDRLLTRGMRFVVCFCGRRLQPDRPYRRARSISWALAEVGRSAGTQFCPATVNAVRAMILTR